MKSKHKFWPHEYVVAVTRNSKTRFFYGVTLKDALAAAGKAVENGTVFSYARFERGKVTVAEVVNKVRGIVRSYATNC